VKNQFWYMLAAGVASGVLVALIVDEIKARKAGEI